MVGLVRMPSTSLLLLLATAAALAPQRGDSRLAPVAPVAPVASIARRAVAEDQRDFSFQDFEGTGTERAEYCCGSGTLTAGVANPDTSGINPSSKCGMYERDGATKWDWLYFPAWGIADAALYLNGDHRLYMDVYTATAPIGTKVHITLEDSSLTSQGWPNGRHSQYVASTTTQGEWERLVFDFSYRPDDTVADTSISGMVAAFDSGTNSSDVYYMDNMDSYLAPGVTASPTKSPSKVPTMSPVPAPVRDYSFEDFEASGSERAEYCCSSGTLTQGTANPDTGGINQSPLSGMYERNGSSKWDWMLYPTSAIADASLYLSGDKVLQMDVYTATAPVGTQIVITLEDNTLTPQGWPNGRHSQYVAYTTKQDEWERLVFDFSYRPDENTSDTSISGFVISIAGNTLTSDVYYLDNIDSYFASGITAAPVVVTAAPTKAPSKTPTKTPTVSPTNAPTANPTVSPTESPTVSPTESPTTSPTVSPTESPTATPTVSPTEIPTMAPVAAPVRDFSFQDFEGTGTERSEYCCSSGSLTADAANPDTSGINPSSKSGMYERDGTTKWDWLFFPTWGIADASLYLNGDHRLYMDVYTATAPVGTKIHITLEDSSLTSQGWPNGRHSQYAASTTTQGEWERLVFDFSYRPDDTVVDTSISGMVVSIDGGTNSSDVYYLDNMDSYLAPDATASPTKSPSKVPTTSPVAAPVRDYSFEDFEASGLERAEYCCSSGALTQDANNPDAGGINPSPLCGMYERDGSSKWDWLFYPTSAIADASLYLVGDKLLQMDVYTATAPVGTEIVITLEDNTLTPQGWPNGRHSSYVAYTTGQSEWERLVFDFSWRPDENTPDTSISGFVISIAGNTLTSDVYYLDNIDSYFAPGITAAPVAITATPTKAPSKNPTVAPTVSPTMYPTTDQPTENPTVAPTVSPTMSPTDQPTESPTELLTEPPTPAPSLGATPSPTKNPSSSPTSSQTSSPTPAQPVSNPTNPPIASGPAWGLTFDNFEDSGVEQATYCCSSGTLNPVATNPDVTGINPSSQCGMYERNGETQWDWMAYSTTAIMDVSPYLSGAKILYMDVYTDTAPIGTQIVWTLEDGSITNQGWPNGRHSQWVAYTTKQSEWERLAFEFSWRPDENVADTSIDGFVISLGSGIFSSDVFYIDNMDSYNAPTAPPTNAPTQNPTQNPTVTLSPTITAAPTPSPTHIHPPVGNTAVVEAGIVAELDISFVGELLTISRVVEDGEGTSTTPVPAGRSHDSHDWESVYPLLLPFNCSSGTTCTVELPEVPGETTYYIVEAHRPPALTDDERAARLLMQTTYGPTKTSIAEVSGMLAADWIATQMSIPLTSHREHYRARANSRLRQGSNLFGVRNPCDVKSRWNRFAFSRADVGKTITTIDDLSNGGVALAIDGLVRAEVTSLTITPSIPAPYVICSVGEYVGGPVILGTEDGSPMKCDSENVGTLGNPSLDFQDTSVLSTLHLPDAYLVDLSPSTLDTKLLQSLRDECNFAATGPTFVRAWSNPDYTGTATFYTHDRRIESMENTLDSVSMTAGELGRRSCPTAPKTFINEQTCEAARGDCAPPSYASGAEFTLDATTVRQFYELDGLYVYRVNGIPIQDNAESPCVGSDVYRWVRYDAGNDSNGCAGGDTPMDADAKDVLINAINAKWMDRDEAQRASARVLDVDLPSNACDDPNGDAIGAQLSVGNSCWNHTHPDEWGVWDLSPWVLHHPGNPFAHEGRRPNPIANIADHDNAEGNLEDSVTITLPSWHPKERFDENKWRFAEVGSWGDVVDFASIDVRVQGPKMAAAVGAAVDGNSDDGFEVCGSPGEIANDPSLGNQYLAYRYGDQGDVTETDFDQDHDRWQSKHMVWNTVSMKAPDQLRQRVAWALSSIFVVTTSDINYEDMSENWAHYYDIFVRNAFGSYFDILKQVAFSPMMGIMLTYENSKSFAYNIEEKDAALFPDENFAREIMQLFSIGLWKLNLDGTRAVDETTGDYLPTYDNSDITTFARGWTGLERNVPRANLEAEWQLQDYSSNYIDPMRVTTEDARDVFPKLGLEDGGRRKYIGDGVQRCDAMPDRAFLKMGAKYRYLGSSGNSFLGREDPDWWQGANGWNPRLVLNPDSSDLYAALCNADPSDPSEKCRFQSTVILTQNLECDGDCDAGRYGPTASTCECGIDEPRVVRIEPSSSTGSTKPTYYEYVRAPCVQMAFPEPGNLIAVAGSGTNANYPNEAMCADARLPVASTACCDSNADYAARAICVFQGERVAYSTAEERCNAYGPGMTTCSWDSVPTSWECGTDTGWWQSTHSAAGMKFTWTNSTCTVMAQISEEGNVAIVHDVFPLAKPVKGRVALDSGTYFRVVWGGDESFPVASSGCGAGSSCVVQDSTCLCSTVSNTAPAFDGSVFPSRGELIAQLQIGAPDPAAFDDDTYHACTAPICLANQASVIVHTFGSGALVDEPLVLDERTIFEVVDPESSASTFLSNSVSTVHVGEGWEFRNPPMFNSPIDQTQRDALYETDAILDHYAQHSNTAPFMATRLIQHLVTSNPSPRYVKAVAEAFTSGRYEDFGSGNYGDMSAMIAAIYLDREASSATLDADATYGFAREPLLKVMHFVRAMELGSPEEREVTLVSLRDRIGQESTNAPSVFSFYLPEFQPAGPVFDKGLVAPQTQLFDMPKLVGYINGLASLPVFGLSECEWYRGLGETNARYNLVDHPEEGRFDCNQAKDFDPETLGVPYRLRWQPSSWGGPTNALSATAASVVSEMDLLLTGGRLHASSRAIIEDAYVSAAAAAGSNGDEAGLRAAQQLFAMTPEFHITNRLMDDEKVLETREAIETPIPEDPPPTTGYKAIVYLYLAGAMDSYNALVPLSACTPADLHQQYQDVRGDVAIASESLLDITVPSGTQPCNVFGLHPSLTTVKELYDGGEASWVANIGPLVEPISKDEYYDQTKEQPPALFAHNTQTQVTQTVHAQDATAGGVLGRIGDVINARAGEEIFDAYSISGTPRILEGAPGVSRAADVLSGYGVSGLVPEASRLETQLKELYSSVANSIFGETFSEKVASTFSRIETLGHALDSTALANGACAADNADSDIGRQFEQVARLIRSRDTLEAKRDVFFVQHGGYDTHSDNGPKLAELLTEVDDALKCFSDELKAQGIWANCTVVTASEFGRTLTSNGLGTDHAWGGNHIILGGSVDGGKIHGNFPDDLTDEGPLNIGRGRLIPTTPWEALWHAVGRWFDVPAVEMTSVLPNLANFPADVVITESDLFK